MPKNSESVNIDLEELLSTKGYDVHMMDSSGESVPTPENCELFQFHFHKNGKDYGTVTITVDGLKNLTVYYNDSIANSGSDMGENDTTTWLSLVKQLKKFAHRRQLGFVLKDSDRIRTDMKRRIHQKQIAESGILGFMSKKPQTKKEQPPDEFTAKLIANRQKKSTKPDEKVYGSEKEFYQTKGQGAGGERVDEISPDLAGRYYSKATKKHLGKSGMKPDMYGRIEKDMGKSRKKGIDRAFDRLTKNVNKGVVTNTQTKLDEGYYGNKKMSYSDDTPTVKMVIKHNRQLEETDQRFRHIEKIFLETSTGERFQVPTNKPSRARAFARHIAEGGDYKDERWSHIAELCEDLDSLGGFVRATKNSKQQFNESAQSMISEAVEQYSNLRETLKQIQSTRGYNRYFESYQPKVISEDSEDLAAVFTNQTLDERIARALPTLGKFGIKMDRINEAELFSEWADRIVDETLDIGGPANHRQVEELVELLSDELPFGPDATVVISELKDVIENEELDHRLRRVANTNPNADARPQVIAWMQEQDNINYQRALEQLPDYGSDDSKKDSDEEPGSDSIEPVKVTPKKKKPAHDAAPAMGDAGGLPPLPPLPPAGGAAQAPLPPLAENDALESFKRLIGR